MAEAPSRSLRDRHTPLGVLGVSVALGVLIVFLMPAAKSAGKSAGDATWIAVQATLATCLGAAVLAGGLSAVSLVLAGSELEHAFGERLSAERIEDLIANHADRRAHEERPPKVPPELAARLNIDPDHPHLQAVAWLLRPAAALALLGAVGLATSGKLALLLVGVFLAGGLEGIRRAARSRSRAFLERTTPVLGVVHHVARSTRNHELGAYEVEEVGYAYSHGGVTAQGGFERSLGRDGRHQHTLGDGVWVLVDSARPATFLRWWVVQHRIHLREGFPAPASKDER